MRKYKDKQWRGALRQFFSFHLKLMQLDSKILKFTSDDLHQLILQYILLFTLVLNKSVDKLINVR